jgi:hypothetical protein
MDGSIRAVEAQWRVAALAGLLLLAAQGPLSGCAPLSPGDSAGLPLADGGTPAAQRDAGADGGAALADGGDPCRVVSITPQGLANGTYLSPDGTQYVMNAQDDAGVFQIYTAPADTHQFTCISCSQLPGGPAPNVPKFMPVWHYPIADWLFIGAEMPNPNWGLVGLCGQSCELGLLVSGLNLNMWAVKPDGSEWFQVAPGPSWPTLSPAWTGYTGPAFRDYGTHAYFARAVDGDIFQYTFGKWTLNRADFVVDGGVPSMENLTDVTPPGANWVETGDFAPDGETLLLSSDIGLAPTQAYGQDQWTYNVVTGALVNLTHSPEVWDEHGLFSPSGRKIVWMSSLPYPGYNQAFNLKTEFMLMSADGSNVVQLTHFNVPGYPESTSQGSVAAVAVWSADGSKLYATQLIGTYQQHEWTIQFAGACGG